MPGDNGLRVPKLDTHRVLLAFAIVIFASSLFLATKDARGGAEELDLVLREWVSKNIYFENDRLLIIRKRPVRAYIKSDDPEIVTEARKVIVNFADAYGLGVEFVTTNANLVVITANGIADGEGKPSRTLLASIGLTESDIDLVVGEMVSWSLGCGIFVTRDKQSKISASILAGDKALPAKKLKSCVSAGITFSFGLRIETEEIFANSNDYIQYLFLARSLAGCERKISAQYPDQTTPVRDAYLECVVNGLKAKLSP